MPRAKKKVQYTHIDNSTVELFMRSLQEQFPKDQLTPCIISGYKHTGKFFIRVVRYKSHSEKETVINCEAVSFVETLKIAINQWKAYMRLEVEKSPTQQLLNFE